MIEAIKKRLEENRAEIATLEGRYNAILTRYQQLVGAVAELELLLNTLEKEDQPNGANNAPRYAGARSHDSA